MREAELLELKAALREMGDYLWTQRWSLFLTVGAVYVMVLLIAAVVYLLPTS